ncbi:MAG TPA: glycosyl hydrolase family 28-related protein [Pseudoxanthomonas sp.]|nr:glycosyl hydrolase family 28-related protein [Pseudoxanthomonas sp.]
MKTNYLAVLICLGFLSTSCGGSGQSGIGTSPTNGSGTTPPMSNVVSLDIVAYGGAIADDLEDDRAAIQKTIDAVHAAGGGTVTIPAGTFLLTTVPDPSPIQVIALEIYSNITLKGTGPGSILKLKDNNGNYDALLGANPSWEIVDNFRMSDLTIDANGANNPVSNELSSMEAMSQNGHRSSLRIYKGKNIQVENCTFTNIKGVWGLVFNGYVEHVKVHNNVFKNIGDAKVDWDHSTIYTNGNGFTITNNRISSLHGAGTLGARAAIEIHGSNQTVSHNSIDGMTSGINVTGYSSWYRSINQVYYRNTFKDVMNGFALWSETDGSEDYTAVYNLENVLIEDNLIEVNPGGWTNFEHFDGGNGFVFEQNRNKDIDRVFIINNKVTFKTPGSPNGKMNTKASGLILPPNNLPKVKVKNLYFLNNTIENSYGPGIYLDDTLEESVIAQNKVRNCGSSSAFIHEPFKSGIFLSGKLSNIQFVCNAVNDTTGSQDMKQIFSNYSHNGGNCIAYNNSSNAASIPVLANSPESSGDRWITNPGKPALSFDAGTVALKAEAGSALLNIVLSKASSTTVNAEIFVLDNTARLGRDFSVDKSTVTFLPGQTSESIIITSLGNALGTAQNKNATLVIKYNADAVAGCLQYAKLILEP